MHVFDPKAVGGKTRGRFDNVDYVDGLPGLVVHAQPTIVPHGAVLLVSGWTVDPATAGPPVAVCVLLDRVRPFYARTGIARGDVMLEHKTDEFVGYQLQVPTVDLGSGAHELRTYALAADGKWYESALAGFRLFYHHSTVHGKGVLSRPLRMHVDPPRDLATGVHITEGTPIHANRWIQLHGWAFDKELSGGAETMVATAEDGRTWSGPANIEHPSASASLGSKDARVGFEVTLPAAVFGRGRHRVQLTALDSEGRRYPNSTEAEFDVISALRPFPLTAREARSVPRYAARLRAVPDDKDADYPESTRVYWALPAAEPIVVSPPEQLIIEGWAIDESGAAADEVFIELIATWVAIPPHRHPALSARGKPVAGIAPAPLENAWFRFAFGLPTLPGAVYELALVVVQPGRRSFSRVPLATLVVDETSGVNADGKARSDLLRK